MIRTISSALLVLTLTTAPAARAQEVARADAIIERHIEARGGAAAIRAIRSLVFDHGAYREPGYQGDGSATMMLMRPYYKLVGHPEREPDFMEGYDGAGWEWYRDPGIVLRTVADASAASRHFADVEGPFLDYADKGSRVELVGEVRIDRRPAYQIRLTMMDGYATDFFIDRRTYQIIASRHTAEVHAFGPAVTSETRFEDFRVVAGVTFPFRSREVEIATGRELNAMQWGSIEANVDIPASWFAPPDHVQTPIQTFIEQMFMQRDDAQAVLWTYHWFRRTHRDTDTREAAEIAGFQILKMEQIETAIALLERNARDYPNAATSAFGLGRAYAAAQRVADARREFGRALELDPHYERARRAMEALPAI